MLNIYDTITERLRATGDWLAPLGIRLILGYEFFKAGMMKHNGNNWFGNIEDKFPLPFSLASADLNWTLSTWTELTAGLALILGLFTRFFAFSLMVLTAVAILTVHWPDHWSSLAELWKGYAISNDGFGNYRVPLIFMVMLLPLVFMGGGKLSLDHLALKFTHRAALAQERTGDVATAGLAALVIGIPLVYLMPAAGGVLLVTAILALAYSLFTR